MCKLSSHELMVDSRHYLDAIVLPSLGVSEHETEVEVLFVWQVFCDKREAAMKLAGALVDI